MPADPTPILQDATTLFLHLPGRVQAVQSALRALLACPLLLHLPQEAREIAELVLAEVLNNIVEHAYPRNDGDINITLRRNPHGLECLITDTGLPMPGGEIPPGTLPPPGDLAEGGFGWHLIRTLSTDLTYRREGQVNRLHFYLTG